MRKVVFYMMAAALLSGCNARNGNIMQIEEQGSFAVGGTVLTDSLGRTYHGDHAYVFYQKPVDARKYPLVFAHGVGQFSKTWETTPDGREGFQNIFLRRGFQTYLVDQPRRGNAGRSTTPATVTPVFDEETWFNRFRVGIWPDYFEGVQFSRDKEALNQYFRQMTPNSRPSRSGCLRQGVCRTVRQDRSGCLRHPFAGRRCRMAYTAADKEHPCHRRLRAGNKRAFPEGQMPEEGKVLTLSKKTEGVEVPMEEFLQFTKIPIIIYYGDNLPETDETAGTVRMDTTPASDAQMGCLAQRTRRRCHGHSSAGDRFEGQHPFSLLRFEQRGGGRSPVEMVT